MLLLKIIRRHFRKNTVFMIIFILCQVLSVISADFVVSYVSARNEYNSQFNEKERTVEINNLSEKKDVVETINLVNEQYSDIIEKCSAWATYNGHILKINLTGYIEADSYISIGKYLSDSGELECLINPSMSVEFNNVVVGDYITIQDDKYKVVGMFPYNYIEISKGTFVNELQFDKYEIVFNYNADYHRMENCISALNSYFSNTIFHKSNYSSYFTIDLYEFVLVLLIFIIANLNICSLYLYIIDEDSEVLSVFKVLGMSSSRVIRWFVCEIMCLSLLGWGIAILIFQFIIANILANINPGLNFVLSIADAILVSLIQIIGIFVVFVPTLNKRYRKIKAV